MVFDCSIFFHHIPGLEKDCEHLLDEVFVIFRIDRIIKVEVRVISRSRRLRLGETLGTRLEADNPYRDLGYSGYYKNRI